MIAAVDYNGSFCSSPETDECHLASFRRFVKIYLYLYLLMMDIRSRALLAVHICEIFVQTIFEAVHERSLHDRLR